MRSPGGDHSSEEEPLLDAPAEKMLRVGDDPQLGFTAADRAVAMAIVVGWQLKDNKEVRKRSSNKPTKMSIGCADAACSFRINCTQVGKGPTVKFTLVTPGHDCDGTARRKRGYSTSTIVALAPTTVTQFHAQGNSHDTFALLKTVNGASDGLHIGKTVARKLLVHVAGSQRLDAFTQFAHVPSFVDALKQFDPAGRYLLQTTAVPNDNRYVYLYCATGWSLNVWQYLRDTYTYDGAKVKTIIEGCLMAVVTLSANNNLVLLSLLYCDSENFPNSSFCMKQGLEDFPPAPGSKTLVFQDAGIALIAGCGANKLEWRRCSHHAVKKLREKHGAIPADLEKLFYTYFRCTTTAAADSVVVKMRKDFTKHTKHIDWIVARRDKLVSTYFIDGGYKSYDQITNNPVEQLYKFILAERSKPIITMFTSIWHKCAEKLNEERILANARAEKRRSDGKVSQYDLVPVAIEVLSTRSKLITGKEVAISLQTATQLRGSVTLSKSAGITARVELTLGVVPAFGPPLPSGVICSHCRVHLDSGLLCGCAIALILAANGSRRPFASAFSMYDSRLAHLERHTSTWVKQCEGEFAVCPYSVPVVPVETQPQTVKPWRKQPPKAGRPKKDNNDGRVKPETTNSYHCSGCGIDGHSYKRCPKLDLDRLRESWETGNSTKRTTKDGKVGESKVGDEEADEEGSSDNTDESDSEQDCAIVVREPSGTPSELEIHNLVACVFRKFMDLRVEHDEEEQFQLACEASLLDHKDTARSLDSILKMASDEGLVEDKRVQRLGDCMLEAFICGVASLDSATVEQIDDAKDLGPAVMRLRQVCIDRILHKYGRTSTDGLRATNLYGGNPTWATYAAKMTTAGHYGDELVFAELPELNGGYWFRTFVGLPDRAYLRESGIAGKPVLHFGLLLDSHVLHLCKQVAGGSAAISNDDAHDRDLPAIVAKSPSQSPVKKKPAVKPMAETMGIEALIPESMQSEKPTDSRRGPRSFPSWTYEPVVPLACCGLVHPANGVKDRRKCAGCPAEEHIACHSSKGRMRRGDWLCEVCVASKASDSTGAVRKKRGV